MADTCCLFWPQMIIEYRDHTKTNVGHIGIWYYIFILSAILSLISIFVLLSFDIHSQVSMRENCWISQREIVLLHTGRKRCFS